MSGGATKGVEGQTEADGDCARARFTPLAGDAYDSQMPFPPPQR